MYAIYCNAYVCIYMHNVCTIRYLRVHTMTCRATPMHITCISSAISTIAVPDTDTVRYVSTDAHVLLISMGGHLSDGIKLNRVNK